MHFSTKSIHREGAECFHFEQMVGKLLLSIFISNDVLFIHSFLFLCFQLGCRPLSGYSPRIRGSADRMFCGGVDRGNS